MPIPIRAHEIGAVNLWPASGPLAQARGLDPEVIRAGAEHAFKDRALLRFGRAAELRRSNLQTTHERRLQMRTVDCAIVAPL